MGISPLPRRSIGVALAGFSASVAGLALAAVGDQGIEVVDLAALGDEVGEGALGFGADVFGVLEKALLAALHLEDELGDGGVGDDFEGVAHAMVGGAVDFAVEGDVDLAVEGGDEVGELVAGAS